MKEISISYLLRNMSEENNYADNIWKACTDRKGKRYRIRDIKNSLNKLEMLGFVKKTIVSGTDTYYSRVSYSNTDDYLGFVNNAMFGNESKIRKALKGLQDKKIFEDISKDLISYKMSKRSRQSYEALLDALTGMAELESSVRLICDASSSEKFKNELAVSCKEIRETIDLAQEETTRGRKPNESIIIQRWFDGMIPSPGCLKM